MSDTTTREDIDLDAQITALTAMAEEEIDALYEGAPESFSEAGPESPEVAPPALGIAPADPVEERVLLWNFRFVNEVIFLPRPDGEWSGESVEFHDGSLLVSRETAERVKQACPYVYEEPQVGEPIAFDPTGFRTRNPQAYAAYVAQYYANL